MNSNVCLVIFIFLSLENVTGLICGSSSNREKPSRQKKPSIEKQEEEIEIHDPGVTQIFNCSSLNLNHQWYQGYQSGKAIGSIPPQSGVKTTRFIIKVEDFDNNTEIYCNTSSTDTAEKKTISNWRVKLLNIFSGITFINLYSKNYGDNECNKTLKKKNADNGTCNENEKPTIITYNEEQKVSFNCLEHINKTKYIQLGLINRNSNMIETDETVSTHKIFNITQNGTILCCVYYVVNETAEEKWITRYVANKTLLLYNDFVQQDALGENLSTSTDLNADPGRETIIIMIITAAAVVFVLLVIIVICQKSCRKKPELDTKVLYADLDILRQIEPDSFTRSGPEEESPYAQIIGVMRPQTK